MENIFSNVFREVVITADDMHAFIVADEDEVKERTKKETSPTSPTSSNTEKKVKRSRPKKVKRPVTLNLSRSDGRPIFATKLKTKIFGRKIERKKHGKETSACEKQEQKDETDGWQSDDDDIFARQISEAFNQAIFPW
eukprot:scaffold9463_cov140-Skeletonema_menzelii.AAC.4